MQAFDIAGHLSAPVNFIVHSYEEVNSLLARGWPFFVDIARDGIPLYDAPGHPLASPKNLAPDEVRAEAQKHFDHWFPSASAFLELTQQAYAGGHGKQAVFLLHQSSEALYHCILLVKSLYSPKSHKLTFLRSHAEQIAPELSTIWPDDTKFAKRCFSRLERAYVDARYSPAYDITDEELAWLTERVKLLQDAVLAVCEKALKVPV
ncbi:HEPN domain-containing protein [Rhizobium skierniewicense]|uniref:HEPN domain-containing protein n=1 Tax=Rhizobium skierniewicense TaxID=984260 RepID=A0A7W6C2P8_9HYPH|nr:HEPN domain-containing protein [Rhizobium skierniewicense]